MQSRAQRRQYGEPVEAAFPEDSLRARHTRGLEAELVSITCSALQIRSPRVHVPLRFSQQSYECRIRYGVPIKPLQRTQSPQRNWSNINEPLVRRPPLNGKAFGRPADAQKNVGDSLAGGQVERCDCVDSRARFQPA